MRSLILALPMLIATPAQADRFSDMEFQQWQMMYDNMEIMRNQRQIIENQEYLQDLYERNQRGSKPPAYAPYAPVYPSHTQSYPSYVPQSVMPPAVGYESLEEFLKRPQRQTYKAYD